MDAKQLCDAFSLFTEFLCDRMPEGMTITHYLRVMYNLDFNDANAVEEHIHSLIHTVEQKFDIVAAN